MKFTTHFESQADKDRKKILKSANRSEFENHPSTGSGKPEQLRFELSG